MFVVQLARRTAIRLCDKTYTKDAKDSIGDDFKPVPVHAVFGLIQDQLAGPKGVKGLQADGGCHCTHEALPHGLVGEVIRKLLPYFGQCVRLAQRNGLACFCFCFCHEEHESHTSRLNNTPPMGEPKATEMPDAAAAERTSRFRACHPYIVSKR